MFSSSRFLFFFYAGRPPAGQFSSEVVPQNPGHATHFTKGNENPLGNKLGGGPGGGARTPPSVNFIFCATSGNQIPGICMFWRPLGLCPGGRFQRKSSEILRRWRWVCALVAAGWVYAPASASKGNPLKSLEMAPDSWDMHTFFLWSRNNP